MSKLSQAVLKIANVEMNESVFQDSLFDNHEENEGMPDDYQTCGECSYDHTYEPEESKKAHDLLESEDWKNCCASSKTADHYNPFAGRRTVETTPMPQMEMPELKSKPSHLDFPEMPKAEFGRNKKEVLQEMQDLLQELEVIESDE